MAIIIEGPTVKWIVISCVEIAFRSLSKPKRLIFVGVLCRLSDVV